MQGQVLALSGAYRQQGWRMGDPTPVRTYLVVVDDSDEARVALRFAARRAAKTGGRIEVLGIVEPQDFVQWGGVQSAIEEEQRLRIEGVVSASVGEILDESGVEATIVVRQGEPVKTVEEYIGTRQEVAALVLGAADSGHPGQLVGTFCGHDAGKLPCPVMLIPGGLSDERLEQLS
jgi:nucleotide-binding universal stress UspA family protein